MRATLTGVGGLFVAAAALTAQNGRPSSEPQQPTFTAGTQYVRVDLYVTRDGHLVDDLRSEEVTILEDGVPQTVDKFERIAFRTPDPLIPPVEPSTIAAARELAADSRSRVFVVFIDPWHSAYVSAASPEQAAGVQRRFPLLREFDQAIGPDDLVAVMTPQMKPEEIRFGRGLRGLAQLEGEWTAPYSVIHPDPGQAMAYDQTEVVYQSCYPGQEQGIAGEMIGRRREKRTLDALDELTAFLGQLREARKAILLVTDGWALYTPDSRLTESHGGNDAPRVPVPPLGGRGRNGGTTVVTEAGVLTESQTDRTRCDAERAALASLDHRQRLDALVSDAKRQNVAFYPASPAGLTTSTTARSGGSAPTGRINASPSAKQSSLKMLAEDTSGYAIVNTNNPREGIERMMADSAAYYLIGYVSTNAALDGRYRRITVRVNRRGIESRARPGYFAATARPTPASAATPVSLALGRLSNSVSVRGPLRVRSASWADAKAGVTTGGFWLVAEVDRQASREVTWARGATAEIIVTAPDGNRLFSDRLAMPSARPVFTIRIPANGNLPPGEYTARLQLQPANGSERITETLIATIPTAPSALGDAMFWRRGPSTGPQPVQTADPRFQRSERLRVEVPVFTNSAVTARLLDRNGALLPLPVVVTERIDPAESFHWAVLDLTLAPLAVGDYALEVTHADLARVTAFRIVP